MPCTLCDGRFSRVPSLRKTLSMQQAPVFAEPGESCAGDRSSHSRQFGVFSRSSAASCSSELRDLWRNSQNLLLRDRGRMSYCVWSDFFIGFSHTVRPHIEGRMKSYRSQAITLVLKMYVDSGKEKYQDEELKVLKTNWRSWIFFFYALHEWFLAWAGGSMRNLTWYRTGPTEPATERCF